METAPVEKSPAIEKKTPNWIGWIGFVVTIGILLQQICLHGGEVVFSYIPALFDGRLAASFSDANAIGPLYKAVNALWIFNDVFLAVFLSVTLVFLALRKKTTPRLLLVFVSFAGLFSLIVGIVMQNLIPAGELQVPLLYNIETAVYIAIDIALFFFYRKSNKFRSLFIR